MKDGNITMETTQNGKQCGKLLKDSKCCFGGNIWALGRIRKQAGIASMTMTSEQETRIETESCP